MFYFKVFKTVVEMLHEWDFFRERGIYITEGTRPSSSVLMLKKLVEKIWIEKMMWKVLKSKTQI